MEGILYPVLTIGGLGLIFGIILGIAGKFLAVKEDPKIGLIREALPGANCGGCGFAGCDAFAAAVVKGEADVSGCPVGGSACAMNIGEIMGVKVEAHERRTAYIKCDGDCNKTLFRYDYKGINDCTAVQMLAGGGSKSCKFGCLGNGSCVRACQFGAINIVDGIAQIDPEKCTECGMCVKTCPRSLIELVPVSKAVRVGCNSLDNGKFVRANCKVGCISCKMCEKACEFDAIHVENQLAKVDYDKCTLCGACVAKCPTNAIKIVKKD